MLGWAAGIVNAARCMGVREPVHAVILARDGGAAHGWIDRSTIPTFPQQ